MGRNRKTVKAGIFSVLLAVLLASSTSPTDTWGTADEVSGDVFAASDHSSRKIISGDSLQIAETIFTTVNAKAEVRLRSGETVQLDSNSIVLYDPPSRTLRLAKGSMTVRVQVPDAPLPPLKIVTPQTRTE